MGLGLGFGFGLGYGFGFGLEWKRTSSRDRLSTCTLRAAGSPVTPDVCCTRHSRSRPLDARSAVACARLISPALAPRLTCTP